MSDVEELARRVLALRAFARALAQGVDGDDLVQGVALTVVERAEHRSDGWLRTVLRRAAALELRRRDRQLARDAMLVVPPSASLDDEAFRARILAALQDALRELDAPSREVLRQRYVEARSAADIARDGGCPASTIRSRIAVALERLRSALDRRFGAREQWCPAIAFAAGLADRPQVASSGGATSIVAGTAAAVLLASATTVAVASASSDAPVRPEASAGVPVVATLTETDDQRTSPRRDAKRRARHVGVPQAERIRDRLRASLAEPPADATHDDAILDGSLFKDEFKNDLIPLAKECFAARKTTRPELRGRLAVAFHLIGAPDIGIVVEQVEFLAANELGDPEFIECVRESALSMSFEPSSASGRNRLRWFTTLE